MGGMGSETEEDCQTVRNRHTVLRISKEGHEEDEGGDRRVHWGITARHDTLSERNASATMPVFRELKFAKVTLDLSALQSTTLGSQMLGHWARFYGQLELVCEEPLQSTAAT